MMDMRGIAFLGFTGFGALLGLLAGAVFGGIAALFGASFVAVALFTFVFCTGVGAVAGLLVEMTG